MVLFSKFVYVVYNIYCYEEMIVWYFDVFEVKV